MLWGALDFQAGSENPYTTAQTVHGGPSAVPVDGGIGVRRVELVFDRSGMNAGEDAAVCHFDFLNITGSTPDDTWTDDDFTTLEGELTTFWGSIKVGASPGVALSQFRWYRVGPGVTKPNPAERVFTFVDSVPGTGTSIHPPQVCTTLTQRNGVRRSWGRTYIPWNAVALSAAGDLQESAREALVTPAATLLSAAADADFTMGTTSIHLNAFLATEQLEVDSVMDVIRRRRASVVTGRTTSP